MIEVDEMCTLALQSSTQERLEAEKFSPLLFARHLYRRSIIVDRDRTIITEMQEDILRG